MILTKGQTMSPNAMSPEVRELVRTIMEAAAALERLLPDEEPDEEIEQGFEFPWRHQSLKLFQV